MVGVATFFLLFVLSRSRSSCLLKTSYSLPSSPSVSPPSTTTGHSERRFKGEGDEVVAKKAAYALNK